MVFILVLITIAALLTVDWYLVRRRQTTPELAGALGKRTPTAMLPMEFFLHPGHAWASIRSAQRVEVGTDHFAPGFAGALAGVELPEPGARLRQGESAWTLVSSSGRRLTQPMPVDGEVLEVNPRLEADPDLVGREPYREGWMLRIRPRRLKADLRNLLHGRMARSFLDDCKSCVTTRISSPVGAVATDGGEWSDSFGDHLDDVTWATLKKELFPSEEPATPDSEG